MPSPIGPNSAEAVDEAAVQNRGRINAEGIDNAVILSQIGTLNVSFDAGDETANPRIPANPASAQNAFKTSLIPTARDTDSRCRDSQASRTLISCLISNAVKEGSMGAMIAITREDKSANELRELASRTKDARVARRRLLAIALAMEGADRTSAACAAGMDRQTLRDRVHRYNFEGVEGLADRKARGSRG